MTDTLLARHIEDIADRLRDVAAAAQAAPNLVVKAKHNAAVELLIETMAPLAEALTLIRLVVLQVAACELRR